MKPLWEESQSRETVTVGPAESLGDAIVVPDDPSALPRAAYADLSAQIAEFSPCPTLLTAHTSTAALSSVLDDGVGFDEG